MSPAAAAPAFEFQSSVVATYLPSPGMGGGVAVADFDDDGDADIFLPTAAGTPNRVYRNRGDGQFDEVAADLGLADVRQARVGLWVDYDGDGDLDLFVGRDCHVAGFDGISATLEAAAGSCSELVLSLFEQRPSGFVEVSGDVGLFATAGSLNSIYHAGGLSAADVSGDGLPDLYAARWQARPELYISDTLFAGGGEAPGYSLGSGLTGVASLQAGHWQALMHDFDDDERLDMFVNVDFSANQFWLNAGELAFVDAASAAGVDSSWNEMGLASGDYDNDGDIDLYITNIHDWQADVRGEVSHNLLYRNESLPGAAGFSEVSESLGVGDTGWGWGTVWLDADNDGDLDLAATNGYCELPPDGYCDAVHERDASRFFENPGNGDPFIDASAATGFDDELIGSGLVAADFDGDGRMDLLQAAIDPDSVPWGQTADQPRSARLTLLLNRPVSGSGGDRFVKVRPRMPAPNTRALGAVVRLMLDNGEILTRLVKAGESWMSQSPATLHFGVPASRTIQRMEVEWPGLEGRTVLAPPAVGQTHAVSDPGLFFRSDFE